MGISLIISSLFMILISFIDELIIKNIIQYYLLNTIIFVLIFIATKFLTDLYIYRNKDTYFATKNLLSQIRSDESARFDYIFGILVLLATVIGTIILDNYSFLLMFGIFLSMIFFGFSMLVAIPQKAPLSPLPVKPIPTEAGNTITKTYRWLYNDEIKYENINYPPFMLISHIRKDVLKCARNKARINLYSKEDLVKWQVYPEAVTEEVREAARRFREISHKNSFFQIEEITNVLSFVQQSIPYKSDEESMGISEYPRYPIETLYDGVGDCECKSFLACSILLELGYDVAFFGLPGHVAVGVSSKKHMPGYVAKYNGKSYYYYESTAEGWSFGQIPAEERGKIEMVIPLHRVNPHDLSECEKKSKLPTSSRAEAKLSRSQNSSGLSNNTGNIYDRR